MWSLSGSVLGASITSGVLSTEGTFPHFLCHHRIILELFLTGPEAFAKQTISFALPWPSWGALGKLFCPVVTP